MMLIGTRQLTLAAAVLLLVASVPVYSNAQNVVERLEEYIDGIDLSGSVLVTEGGSTVFASGYGMANYEFQVANSAETVFRIGSVTKQFTAMGILILQEQSLLRVEDTVGRHLQDAPLAWKELTIHQLLTHTSGIMHSWALPNFRATMALPTTLDETLERFHDQPLLSEPGTEFSYSGVGYFILAKLIEEVSGHKYGDFLQAQIFDPTGMTHTAMDRQEALIPNRAAGYIENEEGVTTNAPDIYMPILTGGGNMYSTVGDLALWDQALANEAFVSAEAYESMFRPALNGYGYGWRVRDFAGTRAMSHGGSVPGFNAFILRLPGHEVCVVVLTNRVPGRAGDVARELARIMLSD